MPALMVGKTEIPYTITHSPRARRQRIVVTAGMVEVIAPVGTTEDQVADFMHLRRRWVFDTRERMLESAPEVEPTLRYISGAKVPYRGRQTRLKLIRVDIQEVRVSYRNGFLIEVPKGMRPVDQEAQVEAAMKDWLKARLREDVAVMIDRACKRVGVEAKGFRLREQKHLWGSCGKDGIIYLNWHLIYAPKTVLEYAVTHEVCHLRHRTHSQAFWSLVKSMLPDFEARKAWLGSQQTSNTNSRRR